MSFDLAVWFSDTTPDPREALALYQKMCRSEWAPGGEYPQVDAFHKDLCAAYPEIDSLPEEALDECPWSCAHDRSSGHMIIAMNYGHNLEAASTLVISLAEQHGLICYDPQNSHLYPPPGLRASERQPWYRFW